MVVSEKSDGCTAQSEPQRENSRRLSYFQVDVRFRRYWSGNQVLNEETQKLENQLRFCPFCLAEIEYDERGHPHCLECGTIFPIPKSILPKTGKTKAYLNRKFMEEYRAVFEGRNNANRIQRGSSASQPKADPEPRADQEATGSRREARATTRY